MCIKVWATTDVPSQCLQRTQTEKKSRMAPTKKIGPAEEDLLNGLDKELTKGSEAMTRLLSIRHECDAFGKRDISPAVRAQRRANRLILEFERFMQMSPDERIRHWTVKTECRRKLVFESDSQGSQDAINVDNSDDEGSVVELRQSPETPKSPADESKTPEAAKSAKEEKDTTLAANEILEDENLDGGNLDMNRNTEDGGHDGGEVAASQAL